MFMTKGFYGHLMAILDSCTSYVQWPEIQPLVSRGQIVSADLPLLVDGRMGGRTNKYNFSVMIAYTCANYVVLHVHVYGSCL